VLLKRRRQNVSGKSDCRAVPMSRLVQRCDNMSHCRVPKISPTRAHEIARTIPTLGVHGLLFVLRRRPQLRLLGAQRSHLSRRLYVDLRDIWSGLHDGLLHELSWEFCAIGREKWCAKRPQLRFPRWNSECGGRAHRRSSGGGTVPCKSRDAARRTRRPSIRRRTGFARGMAGLWCSVAGQAGQLPETYYHW